MEQSNHSFIFNCELCGQEERFKSEITLRANFGSVYDGEILTLSVCGDCIDKIFNYIRKDNAFD